MFLPPRSTPFICSRASCAASGKSYSTNANPCNITGHKKAVSKDGYKRNDIAFTVSRLGRKGIVERGMWTHPRWDISELSSETSFPHFKTYCQTPKITPPCISQSKNKAPSDSLVKDD